MNALPRLFRPAAAWQRPSLTGFSSQVKHHLLRPALLSTPHARCPGSLSSQHFYSLKWAEMYSMPVTPPECRFHEESDLLICHHLLSTASLPGFSGISEKWIWVASQLQRPHPWSAVGSPAYPAGGRGSIREQGACSVPGCPVSAETGGADSRAQLGGRPPSHAQLGRISFCCSRLFLTVHTGCCHSQGEGDPVPAGCAHRFWEKSPAHSTRVSNPGTWLKFSARDAFGEICIVFQVGWCFLFARWWFKLSWLIDLSNILII